MRALVFLATLLIAAPSLAQSLLVELQNATLGCYDCAPVDMQITLGAGPVGAAWSQPITQSDVGRTFNMPVGLLDAFGVLTGDDDVWLDFALDSAGPGGPNGTGYVPSGIFTHGSLINNPQVIRHATVLGPNLTGYTISSITQTLNSLNVNQIGFNFYSLNAVSTFRIYGAAIPEPSAFVLLVFAHCLLRVRLPRR